MASANAVSYFVRSWDWGTIIVSTHRPKKSYESIGFPFEMWEAGNVYGGWFVDYPMFAANIFVALLVSVAIGAVVATRKSRLNEMVAYVQSRSESRRSQPLQFSVRGIMITTAIIAVIVTLANRFAATRQTLLAIYALGPLCLVAIAMAPQRISWQTRVKIIIPLTIALIGIAISVGSALGMEFDRVLLGIVLFWLPQSAIAALLLTSYLTIRLSNVIGSQPRTDA